MALVAAVSVLAPGCVFYPQIVEHYDAGCQIRARQMVLKSEMMSGVCGQSRTQEEAAGCLVIGLGITAGSAIVSGSIVVAGNTIYWFEKQGRCVAKS